MADRLTDSTEGLTGTNTFLNLVDRMCGRDMVISLTSLTGLLKNIVAKAYFRNRISCLSISGAGFVSTIKF